MSFNNLTTTIGVKGSDVYTDNQAFLDLWVMLFQNRDVRGGKGERASTEIMWKWMADKMPLLTNHMLILVPEYGCWRDLFALAEKMPSTSVSRAIIQMAAKQIQVDERAVLTNIATNSKEQKVSLLAKWIPREDRQGDLAKLIAKEVFPTVDRVSTRLKSYRKMVSAVNKYLKTVEVSMCAKEFSSIEPKAVPGRALKKHMRAFLNEKLEKTLHGSVYRPRLEHSLRHRDDDDRMECRQHFIDFFQQAKEGKVVAKAANVVYPHELIKKIAHSAHLVTDDERNGIVAQWLSLVKAAKDAGGLGRSLAMCDFSGSMQSSKQGDLPYWVSMAMGLLISEVTTDEFKNSFLTFDSNPILHKMDSTKDVVDRTIQLMRSGVGQGLSTDFQKAMDLVLQHIKANRIRPGQEPENLIVITDMGWDAACGSDRASKYTGNRYRHVVKTDTWQTHIQMIREAFKRAGEDMWGVPLVPPRIVIWNVAASYQDFHATKDTEGVVMLSGWSPSLFKNLMKGDIRSMTPMEMLRIQLDDDRYDPVRDAISSFVASRPAIFSSYLIDKARA
jgi:hypothetical protein